MGSEATVWRTKAVRSGNRPILRPSGAFVTGIAGFGRTGLCRT